jgi:protein O-mannosyl-transferase
MAASTNRHLTIGLSIALAIVTLLTYCRSFDFDLIQFDDPDYVFENRHVLAGLTSDGMPWAFTTFRCANWHPLTWLSLQLDACFTGAKPGGYHATNVYLHIANTVLLFLVFKSMTGAIWRSAMLAALFALHPLRVESVAWISERKDVLSTLFWILTIAAYLAFVRNRSLWRYLLVILAFTLGLLAKPMLVTLPFVLLLLDYWPLGQVPWGPTPANPALAPGGRTVTLPVSRLVLEKLPLLAIAAGSSIITFQAQRALSVRTLDDFPLSVRIANALVAYATYLWQMLIPKDLAIFYPHPGTHISMLQAAAAGFLLTVLTWVVLWSGRQRPYLPVGWFWYLGTLVPVIGLVQVGRQSMADRYTYVPLIGCFLMLVWGCAELAVARKWSRPWLFLAAGTALGTCCTLTWIQLGYWQDDYSLWKHTVDATPGSAEAQMRLADSLARGDHLEKSEAEYHKALEIDPDYAPAHLAFGNALNRMNRLEEALTEYRKAIDLQPDSALTRYNFAHTLAYCGFLAEAEAEFRQAIDLDAKLAAPHYGLGMELRLLGRRGEAVDEFRKALALDQDLLDARTTLRDTLLELGEWDQAEQEANQAMASLPPNYRQHQALEFRQRSMSQWRTMEEKLTGVLDGKSQPANVDEQLDLAWLCQLSRIGQFVAAARLYADALKAHPELGSDPSKSHLHRAAVAAVQASAGLDKRRGRLDEEETARLRQQALGWLRDELAIWSKQAQSTAVTDRRAARRILRQWQLEPELTPVRDAASLATCSESERTAWQEFWQQVEKTLSSLPLGDTPHAQSK